MGPEQQVRPPATISVIGLGNMGQPMAARLLKGGYDVIGFDVSEAARERLRSAGGRPTPDLATAAAAAVVITVLPDGHVVRDVVRSLRPHLLPGRIVVDMSSSDPVGTRALGAELRATGHALVDAPVSGGVKRAVDGALTIMAGGDAAILDQVEPVLLTMGRSVFRTGPLGSGHAMKALNNYISAAGLVAAVEAIGVGRSFGLEPAVMTEVLNASTGRNNSTELKLKQFILSKRFDSGFALRLMAKDVRTADDLARAVGVATPLADVCARLWDDAALALEATADHTEIVRYLSQLGVEP